MNLNEMAEEIHETCKDKGFWSPVESDTYEIEHFYALKLALISSEVSEVLEAMRSDEWEKVPEELADIIIRVLDLATGLGYTDMEQVIENKMARNAGRPYLHGKIF